MYEAGRAFYIGRMATHSTAFDAHEWLNEQQYSLLSLLLLALPATHSTLTIPLQPHQPTLSQ